MPSVEKQIKIQLEMLLILFMALHHETGKHGKVEMERNWWVLVQSPYSLQGNGRQSPRVEPCMIDNPTWRRTHGPSILKGWEDKRDNRLIVY